jgi:hypothetical protein
VDENNLNAAVEGAVNAKEPGTSCNIPTTDQASTATSNTNPATTRNTSFEDISAVPLVKRPKLVARSRGLRYRLQQNYEQQCCDKIMFRKIETR